VEREPHSVLVFHYLTRAYNEIDRYFLMGMLVLVHLSSSEIMSCKESGQRFATADALIKHKKFGMRERELQNKGL
jgi:hypothetical protein